MSFKDAKSAIFFRVGSIGYIVGFFAWFTWFFLVIWNLIFYWLGYGYSNIMSGIYYQAGPYSLVVYGLFSVSFLLGSFGCFGLKRRYNSNLALICGVFYIAVFAVLCYTIVSAKFQIYSPSLRDVPMFLNLGLLFWGATLLALSKSLPHPRLSSWIGGVFVLIPALTLTLFWQVIMYWGVEFWFLLFGWLYAICAAATVIILWRLSKICCA